MKLQEANKEIDTYSTTASTIVRQLALAGIAIVWLFKTGKPEAGGVPYAQDLLLPLGGFALALLTDLLQYVYSAFAWYGFLKSERSKGKKAESEVTPPAWINAPNFLFFVSKIVLVVAGYLFLLTYIARSLP